MYFRVVCVKEVVVIVLALIPGLEISLFVFSSHVAFCTWSLGRLWDVKRREPGNEIVCTSGIQDWLIATIY